MNKDDRSQVHEKARKHAEATVYRMDNSYLDEQEKFEVELWYQSPGNCQILAFTFCAIWYIYQPLDWKFLLGVPLAVNLLTGLANWYLYSRRLISFFSSTLGTSLFMWATAFIAIGLSIYTGHYLLAGLVLAAHIGIFSLFEPHMVLFSFLSLKYKVHPKFVFFKKFYGYTFPFEESS